MATLNKLQTQNLLEAVSVIGSVAQKILDGKPMTGTDRDLLLGARRKVHMVVLVQGEYLIQE